MTGFSAAGGAIGGASLQALAGVSWERAAGPLARTEDEAIAEVARQFEALFIGSLLKSMRATEMEAGLLGKDRSAKMYREMHDEALAAELAKGQGLGIGELLSAELGRARLTAR